MNTFYTCLHYTLYGLGKCWCICQEKSNLCTVMLFSIKQYHEKNVGWRWQQLGYVGWQESHNVFLARPNSKQVIYTVKFVFGFTMINGKVDSGLFKVNLHKIVCH